MIGCPAQLPLGSENALASHRKGRDTQECCYFVVEQICTNEHRTASKVMLACTFIVDPVFVKASL